MYIRDNVAQDISFDSTIPWTYPTNKGNLFQFDPTTNRWKLSERLIHHNWAPIGDSYASSLNGTLQFNNTFNYLNFITGTATGFKIKMPNATTLDGGEKYEIHNTTPQTIGVYDFSNNFLFTLSQNSMCVLTLQDNTTADGTWRSWQILLSSIASGIISYNLTAATAFTSSVRYPSFDTITSFSITPQAGTYGVWYSASVFYTTVPKFHYWQISKNGVAITDSIRTQDTSHSSQNMSDNTQTIVSCNGTDVITIQVACDNTGSLTVNQRSLLMMRLGA